MSVENLRRAGEQMTRYVTIPIACCTSGVKESLRLAREAEDRFRALHSPGMHLSGLAVADRYAEQIEKIGRLVGKACPPCPYCGSVRTGPDKNDTEPCDCFCHDCGEAFDRQ